MQTLKKSIVLIGFKHTGKSIIGKSLAKKMHVPFIDLDRKIESLYEDKFHKKRTCRQIMEENGESYFCNLEHQALSKAMNSQACILSLGGATSLYAVNQAIIKSNLIIHITAEKGIVFERICMSGRPAFFNPEENFLESFNRLWDEREKIYQKIRDFFILNNDSVDSAVQQIINTLTLKEYLL
jgi:shikimate kinase